MAGIAAHIIEQFMGSGLPADLPAEPMSTLIRWHDEAKSSSKYTDPNAMALATSTPDGRPSVRMVLCKAFEISPAAIVFYTNHQSRKADELSANPYAAAVFHWPHVQRQARLEGVIEPVSDAESDEYFASRSLISRLGAWASQQSRPLKARADLVQAVLDAAKRFGISSLASAIGLGGSSAPQERSVLIPRPPNWGGYRIKAHTVELWVGGEGGRLHDRAVWKLRPSTSPSAQTPQSWDVGRLYP